MNVENCNYITIYCSDEVMLGKMVDMTLEKLEFKTTLVNKDYINNRVTIYYGQKESGS